ncbi:MAG: FAD:protein FMN transferase [Bacteroidota bacterium]|nr:FAD:protein FMN transferase [Bacteroidota bacterium]MDP4190896.1 FAD:protein FMN transferase [Bacteroidota bacterium]MDP4195300.1 FAD:protein FMN transferase [Bacteroidota bacterium]
MKVYHNSFYAMGSRFNLVLPSSDDELCEQLSNEIEKEVKRLESKLSYFDTSSQVYRINKEAYKKEIEIDDELFKIIKTCFKYHEITFGAFDITLRPVIEHLKSGETHIDSPHSQFDNIILDESRRTVHYLNNNVKIDFGGFGKGYALEKVKRLIDSSLFKNAFISFGESSILVKGSHPKGKFWCVGIKDFYQTESAVHQFKMVDKSVSSSSNYYLDDNGKLCYKLSIINPFKSVPAEDISIVSVLSESPLTAEILSTALLVLEDYKIQEIIRKVECLEVIKIVYNDKVPEKKVFKKGNS